MSLFKESCGGCGETRSDRRCFGCFHEAIDWVEKDKSQPEGVRVKGVKGLEWKDGRPDTMQGETKRREAHTITGWFTAYECYGKFWYETPTHKDFNARPAASMDEAIAAAEADYRQRILSALETQEEEAVDAETRLSQLEEIADGAWGDNPMVRGKARDEAARLRSSAHSTPVQKEEEGQTVSEEMLERGIDAYRKLKNEGIRNYEDIVIDILTAALVKP